MACSPNPNQKPEPNVLRKIILSSTKPLLLKNILDWELLDWDLQKWIEKCGAQEFEYRRGKNSHTKNPQWQTTTEYLSHGTLKQLLNHGDPSKWVYFDYKYLHENLLSVPEIQNISWKRFGFTDMTAKDSTIWMGSKGAHTPCHVDVYGCNLIAQIIGCKRWILFPPEENLKPTRVPFEESTVYSKLNFFSPNVESLKGITNAYSVLLKPGEVLFVPHNWWHYVESVETTISINVWLPLPIDDDKRLEESIAQSLVAPFMEIMSEEECKYIYNPEDLSHFQEVNVPALVRSVQMCVNICKGNIKRKRPVLSEKLFGQESLDENEIAKYASFIEIVEKMGTVEFKDWLRNQSDRFQGQDNDDVQRIPGNIELLLDAITKPNVLNAIKNNLLRS